MLSSGIYQDLFAQNPLPMFVFDAGSLALLDVNAAAVAEYGWSRETLLGLSVKDVFNAGSVDPHSGQPQPVSHRRADGKLVELQVSTRVLQGTAPALCVGVACNVTQRQQSETLLRELNEQVILSGLREQASRQDAERASSAKDEFLAVISHELRTPLQAMTGWIALLRGGTLGAEDSARALEVIDRNTRIQAQLVADLLDVSRATSGKLRLDTRPLDLRRLVAGAIEPFRVQAERKGVRLEAALEGPAMVIQGDSTRLEQVVMNLLSNAIKFTPSGGAIRVELDAGESDAHLRVCDTGQGFADAFMPRMFQSFAQEDSAATRAHGGLGLGLMIVRHLVHAHGGRIRAESGGTGAGATFILDFPLSADKAAADTAPGPPQAAHAEKGPLAGLRALVVEDHPDSRDFVRVALQDCGAQVGDAGSAGEALAMLATLPVDVVVSDLGMPGMDGYALLRSLRQTDGPARDVPVIALSASASAEDRERAIAAGFFAHAAKPITPAELTRIVARAAGRSGA